MMDQAGGTGAMGYFRGGDRRLARAYAIQPVAMMVGALIQMYLIGANLRADDLWIAGFEGLHPMRIGHGIAGRGPVVSAGDEYPALCPFEFDAVGQGIADDHFHAVGIERLGLERAMHIPEPFGGE